MQLISRLKTWARLLKQDILTLWFATKLPQTPWISKVIAIFIVAYAFSPIDLIPDFIPIIGFLDEIILLPVLIWLAIRSIPCHIIQEAKYQAEQWSTQNQEKLNSKLGALLVIGVWLLTFCIAYQLIYNK